MVKWLYLDKLPLHWTQYWFCSLSINERKSIIEPQQAQLNCSMKTYSRHSLLYISSLTGRMAPFGGAVEKPQVIGLVWLITSFEDFKAFMVYILPWICNAEKHKSKKKTPHSKTKWSDNRSLEVSLHDSSSHCSMKSFNITIDEKPSPKFKK